MPVSAPNYTNVFIPGVTENLIVDYSRNWKDITVNMLSVTTPVDKPIGYYPRIKPDATARVGNPEESIWSPGAPRPVQLDNQFEFDFDTYNTQLYQRSVPIPYDVEKNAIFDVRAKYASVLANKLMLLRARTFYSILANSNNHLANHVQTAATWGTAGTWSTSTVAQSYIQQAIMSMARTVIKDSVNSGVGLDDLFLVVGPELADLMARSPELKDFIKGSPNASPYLEFKLWAEQQARYGLPQVLYGVKVVVDETVSSTSKIGETFSASFLPTTSSAYMIVKKNWRNNSSLATDFGSVHFFVHKDDEMKTESFDEPINRREILSVTDRWDAKLVARETTCVATSIS